MQRSQHIPASAGWDWLKSALEATRKQPLMLTGVVAFYILTMSLLTVLPWVGSTLAALFMPFGTVFIARATQVALLGNQPHIGLLVSLWRDRAARLPLMQLGVVFAAMLSIINMLYGWLAADDISQWVIDADGRIYWESITEHIPWTAIVVSLTCYIPCMMALWFAPLLASQQHMACGKSLFYSFFGCLRHTLPLLVLGLLVSLLSSVVGAIAMSLIAMLGLMNSATLLLTPLALIVSTIIYATYWPMYATLFESAR